MSELIDLKPKETLFIGEINSYYGGLATTRIDDKYYWGLEDSDGIHWEEIPEHLYNALVKFETERKK